VAGHARGERTIGAVRRPPVRAAALAVAVAAASVLTEAAPAAGAGPTVPGAIARLQTAGAVSPGRAAGWRRAWDDALRVQRGLRGPRRAELGAVLANTRAIAAAGLLTASRGPAVFLTVQRNRQWWASRPLLAPGARVLFTDSELVWQHYAGQGIQIQWLGTFGRANALFTGGRRYDERLRALIGEVLPLAADRAGGRAWEYLFRFDGGRPPWVSGLAQGTAVQALSRAAIRLGEPPLLGAARAALGVFRAAPPQGVRVATPAGAHYLIYSFAPQMRVLNGFVQALNGLLDFARYANDPDGLALFDAGEAQLAAELSSYDTGAWSLYSPGHEADLGYHRLARDFLRTLCARLGQTDASRAARYCEAAERFERYLHEPPRLTLRLAPGRPRARRVLLVRIGLSKVSTVTAVARRKGRVVWTRTERRPRGLHAFGLRPARAGPLHVSVRAVDLAGNAASVGGSVDVRPARRART
jgi:hypothetical protein